MCLPGGGGLQPHKTPFENPGQIWRSRLKMLVKATPNTCQKHRPKTPPQKKIQVMPSIRRTAGCAEEIGCVPAMARLGLFLLKSRLGGPGACFVAFLPVGRGVFLLNSRLGAPLLFFEVTPLGSGSGGMLAALAEPRRTSWNPGETLVRGTFTSQHGGTLVEPCWNLTSAVAEPRDLLWNFGGTLVEPSWNLTSGPPRTTPEPIWAETPKRSAVGEKN